MKRRVGRQICHREPRAVERGAKWLAEHGLGAAWPTVRLGLGYAGNAPVTAQECDGTLKGRLREELCETRWYHDVHVRSSLMRKHAGRVFLFLCGFLKHM